jgi:selenocysteine-specific elongation factor
LHYFIIGTAGHIDHGKTTLIKSLTGIETDRLKEEKERGISIDLGFAYLDTGKGERFGIVDVPGHEKFIKNMVAGAAGMDIVLLVVDANEGVMPQTIEHLDILRFLSIKKGVIIITKIDLSTEEQIKNTKEEILDLVKGTFLETSPVVLFSSTDGTGIKELKKILGDLYEHVEKRDINAPLILPVDRVFTISGFGTVITGTLQKGTINKGDILEFQPGKIEARVRNIQVHNDFVDSACAGQRVAVNVTGVEKEDLERGNWLVCKGVFSPVKFIDCHFTRLSHYKKDFKSGSRVRLHIGTNEIIGRITFIEGEDIKPGDSQLVQFNLEKPVIASYGDHFIVRNYSPMETIGGGKVLCGGDRKHKKSDKKLIEYLTELEKGEKDDRIEKEILHNPFQSYSKFIQQGHEEDIKKLIEHKKIVLLQDNLLHIKDLKHIEEELVKILKDFHKNNPLRIGANPLEITRLITKYRDNLKGKLLREILEKLPGLDFKRGRFKIKDFEIKLNEKQETLRNEILSIFEKNLFKPPSLEEIKEKFGNNSDFKQVFAYLLEQDMIVAAKEGIMFHKKAIGKAKDIIYKEIKSEGKITAAKTRDLFNTNRKYAIVILEYFDSINFTKRIEDNRILVTGE